MPSSDPRYFLFLGVVAAVLLVVPRGTPRLVAIALTSLGFYMGFNPAYGLLLLLVATSAYAGALIVAALPPGSARSGAFVGALSITLAPLFVFKYWRSIQEALP